MAVAHKGAISFGLVHIPIQLYRTTQDTAISFNQLCKDTHERVKYKKYCPNCDKELKSEDIVKGYQYEKDKYVIMTNDEIEKLKVEKDRTIQIQHFTSLANINDLYYEKNYYAVPEKHAEKAYELLRKAMQEENVVAVAKTVIGTKETLLALCPSDEEIIVKTLFYEEELVENPKTILHPDIDKAELNMAKQLITSMSKPFEPETYHGHQILHSSDRKEDHKTPIDLMEALKQSIEATKPKTKRKRVRH